MFIYLFIYLYIFFCYSSFALWMDLSRMWEWDAVVWSPAVTVMLARLSILWAGSGLSLGWVVVCIVAGEYPVVHVCVCRSDGKRYTHGGRWDRRRVLWACVKRAANYGILRCNEARIRFRRGWRGRLRWTQEVVSFPIVTVERSTPTLSYRLTLRPGRRLRLATRVHRR